MLVNIPPHISAAQFMGYLKGKSSLMIFDRHANLKYKYGSRSFWCGGYYLFYERVRPLLLQAMTVVGLKGKSEIYCTESTDLKIWTKPQRVIGETQPFEEDEKGLAISNPFLLPKEDGYRQ